MEFDKLANQYTGHVATSYDARREQAPKWANEQACVDGLLAKLARGSTIVDIPVGTGRFLDNYAAHGLVPTGFDISRNMLDEAKAKAPAGLSLELREADIRRIPAADGAFDTALCVRFLNWVDVDGFRAALRELARVARTDLIVSVRHYTPPLEFDRDRHGAIRFARQIARRVSRRLRPRGITVHERTQVHGTFAELGLVQVSATCIERRADGTDYFIYHLRKR